MSLSAVENLNNIQHKVQQCLKEAKRPTDQTHVLIASKTRDEHNIRPLLKSGHRLFGENRVQEALSKWPSLQQEFPDTKLHLIGPLQTNKTKEAVKLFDLIETLDREKLARCLQKEMAEQNKNLPCFIQVNTGEEPQKKGILPAELDDFYHLCVEECQLQVTGLMCIPPQNEAAALHFALLANLAKKYNLTQLSMGMSADFQTALLFNSSEIRIGSDIFGPRTP